MGTGNVITFPVGEAAHGRTSSEKISGRISSRGMPVKLSTSRTRLGGTPRSIQRETVLLLTEQPRAKSRCLKPRSASNVESDLLMEADSCTTNNAGQVGTLRNLLTTDQSRIGMLAPMKKRQSKPVEAPLEEIFQKRQPRRPHYVGRLMELRNLTRSQMIEDLAGLDKSILSRWLDEADPSTPGKMWTKKLGEYFAVPPDYEPVDIFADPDIDWLYRLLRNRSAEEKDRIRAMIEAAFPVKRAS